MLRINDHDIFVQDTGGDKPAVLFLHGIMMDHSVWQSQVAVLSTDFRVVCVDLRGFGQSTTISPEISFEDHMEDILAVMSQCDLKDVTIVGWSMGGAIAQVLAARAPAELKRLVLVDTTPQLLADNDFAHALPVEAAQQLGQLLSEDFVAGCDAFCGMVSPENATVAARLSKIAAATRPDIALNAFQSSGARSLLAEIPKISTPTWVIVGEKDAICLQQASHFMADSIPGCVTDAIVVPDAGHAPFLTSPVAFNDALVAILKQRSL